MVLPRTAPGHHSGPNPPGTGPETVTLLSEQKRCTRDLNFSWNPSGSCIIAHDIKWFNYSFPVHFTWILDNFGMIWLTPRSVFWGLADLGWAALILSWVWVGDLGSNSNAMYDQITTHDPTSEQEYGFICDYMGLYGIIWDYMGLYIYIYIYIWDMPTNYMVQQ